VFEVAADLAVRVGCASFIERQVMGNVPLDILEKRIKIEYYGVYNGKAK
jgi:hypothetical protein